MTPSKNAKSLLLSPLQQQGNSRMSVGASSWSKTNFQLCICTPPISMPHVYPRSTTSSNICVSKFRVETLAVHLTIYSIIKPPFLLLNSCLQLSVLKLLFLSSFTGTFSTLTFSILLTATLQLNMKSIFTACIITLLGPSALGSASRS